MGKIFIIISTVLLLIIIGTRNAKNNRRLFTSLKRLIKEINSVYKDLFKDMSILKRITQGGLIIGAEIFIAIAVSTAVIKHIDTYTNFIIDLIIKLIIIFVSLVIIHFCMGYILLATVKIHKFIYGVENKNVKVDLLLSYFIISTYFTVLLVFPHQFKESYRIGLLGVAICYLLNIRVLVMLMTNPHNIKSKNQEGASFSRIIIAAILIVVLIVLNLYLAVCFVSGSDKEAFTNSPSYFDLFYYTIITFTTVGYGDIVPITIEAKFVSILISLTNIICITVFLSTILSYRDKVEDDI
ncbi:potassium channel family protein [Clostridium sp. D53t1_180928_C8]|uniref:potassium channel family protein n=1 Tax=Clostridium sp. D53t1_180928_C8 TaxID=2787101 RepID=UPI0018AB9E57|nr:potassium channel family protein [Clostridium sp. D53t1_180928_C8]